MRTLAAHRQQFLERRRIGDLVTYCDRQRLPLLHADDRRLGDAVDDIAELRAVLTDGQLHCWLAPIDPAVTRKVTTLWDADTARVCGGRRGIPGLPCVFVRVSPRGGDRDTHRQY